MSSWFRIAILLLHLMAISLLKLAAQEFTYKHYSIPEGLVQTQVQCLFQDSRGYIWVGTKGGLSRFDGENFVNYSLANGMKSSFIYQIYEDRKGNIYTTTRSGIAIIHPNGNIQTISFPNENPHMSYLYFPEDGLTYGIFYASQTNNWVQYILKGDAFTFLNDITPKKDKLQSDKDIEQRLFIYNDSENSLLALSPQGNLQHWLKNKLVKSIHLDLNPLTIHKGNDGNLYLADGNWIYRLSGNNPIKVHNTHNLVNVHKSNNMVFPGNNVFSVASNGEIVYQDTDFRLHYVRHGNDYCDFKKFTSNGTMLFDDENNLWFGLDASGLYRVNESAFVNFIPEKCGIPNYPFGVVEDTEKNLWFGSLSEGLVKYDGNHFRTITNYKSIARESAFYPGSLLTSDRKLLIAHSFGLMEYKNGRFSWFYKDDHPYSVYQTLEDKKRGRIVSSCNIVMRMKDRKGKETKITLRPGNKKNTSIVSLSIDSKGRYWLGSFGGMSIWDEGKVTHLPTKEYPYDIGATCQYWDEKERLWIGHETGLYLLEKGKVSRLGKSVMPHWVNAISRLDQDHLLIGAINGLGILDLKHFNETGEAKIELYNQENGYEGVEVNQNGIFKDSKGYFWIINADRVVRLEPGALRKNTTPPPVVIRKIWGFKEDMSQYVLLDHWKQDTSVTYSWHETKLRFEFNAISFTARPRIRYQYQLVGFDKAWSAPNSENTATYTNLSPGHYVFKVRAFNNSGLASPEDAIIHIHIKPAFWQTWWFYTLIILGFLAGTVSLTLYFNNRRRNQKHQELRKEKELIDLQLKTIRNQIDPHFTFNAMNSIGAVIYKEDKLKAYSFFSRFSGLIRAVLESSDKTERSLQDEIEFVTNYLELEKLRFKEKFDYTIDVDPNVDTGIQVPKLIIQAYAENALKHGLMHREIGGRLEIKVHSPQSIVHSPRSTVDGQQSIVDSPWSIVNSSRSTVDGPQTISEGQQPTPESATKYPKQKSEDNTTVDRRPSTVDYITITITDNGVGRVFTREYNRNNPASTGKGLHIMEDYYALFEKLYNIRITADIEDLYTETGEAAGTRVRVTVPVRKG